MWTKIIKVVDTDNKDIDKDHKDKEKDHEVVKNIIKI